MSSKHEIKRVVDQLSTRTKVSKQIILKYLLFETFLEKLSHSQYANQLILKGGFLIGSLLDISQRTTMDLDFTYTYNQSNATHIHVVMDEILTINATNDLTCVIESVIPIRQSLDESGFRYSICIQYMGFVDRIKIDVTLNDPVPPHPQVYTYRRILDSTNMTLKTYSVENILSEKLHTIITRSTVNSRLRDYYDMYSLWRHPHIQKSLEILFTSIHSIFEYRNTTSIRLNDMIAILREISIHPEMTERWELFQYKNDYAKGITFSSTLESIIDMVQQLIHYEKSLSS